MNIVETETGIEVALDWGEVSGLRAFLMRDARHPSAWVCAFRRKLYNVERRHDGEPPYCASCGRYAAACNGC